MGSSTSKSTKHLQLLLLGLSGSGKSLFLSRLLQILDTTSPLEPTFGFNFVCLSSDTGIYDLWEVGGDPTSINYWPTFYRNIQFDKVIYVIDIADKASHKMTTRELVILLNEGELRQAQFLIIFNTHQSQEENSDNAIDSRGNSRSTNINGSFQKLMEENVKDFLDNLSGFPIFEFAKRVEWEMFDIGTSKYPESFISKCFNKKQEMSHLLCSIK